MQGVQKTLDGFLLGDRAEPEIPAVVQSMDVVDSRPMEGEYNLIGRIASDENLKLALERVVENKGAPGIDGMTVYELVPWMDQNREELKQQLILGTYRPTPVRRKEIPKPDGGVRNLGVPTVVDRLVQQAMAQIMVPIYEPKFSEHSYGFRPKRSAHDAITEARRYYDKGYKQVVDLDLEKFFDKLNQDFLMNIVRETIKDRAVIDLIKRFLKAGVIMPDGLKVRSDEGAPQGGPLSPLLSNIYLDKLDKELERRGHHYIRYADDVNIYLKSRRAAERVMESITRFIEDELRLKVNREKSAVGSPAVLKFLGFKLYPKKGGVGVTIHPKSVKRFRKKVIEITKRNRGVKLEMIIEELRRYEAGWLNYYGQITSSNTLKYLDKFVRRRIRLYVFKQWKKPDTRFKKLKAMCPKSMILPDGRIPLDWIKEAHAVALMNLWVASGQTVMNTAFSMSWMREHNVFSLEEQWKSNRLVS